MIDEPFDLEQEPLEKGDLFDIDWGGDGADPDRPVRAHVLAALRPSSGPYQPPLDALLALGDVDAATLAELGIGQEHVSELVRMLRDRDLNTSMGDDPKGWGPSHALDILADLDLSAHIDDIIPVLDLDFDRFADAIVVMASKVGAPAVAPLRAYLEDQSRWVWGRSRAAGALGDIVEQHPELRAEVVPMLSDMLSRVEELPEEVATGVMGALVDIKAVETLPLIRRAFELGKINETMYGPWGEVLKTLGIAPDADDPLIEESHRRYQERWDSQFPPEMLENIRAMQARQQIEQARAAAQTTAKQRKQEKFRKEKNKRKTASASRKANRKKRK